MSAGFTPGPWRFVPWHIAESASEVRAPDGWLVCATSSDANARLIAAAPALYEALEGAGRHIETLLSADPDMPTSSADYDEAEAFLKNIAAALALARGDGK